MSDEKKSKTYIYDGKEWTWQEMHDRLAPKPEVASRLEKTLNLVEGEEILDVGCGVGTFAYRISKKAKHVIGIDILPTSIEIAKDFFKSDNLEFKVADLFEERFPDNSFDCILFLETIEHVDSPVAFIKEFHRILKPNGCLIVSTPNARSYSTLIREVISFLPTLLKRNTIERSLKLISKEPRCTGTHMDHIYSWDIYTLYRLLNRCGFEYETHAFAGCWPFSIEIMGFPIRILPFSRRGREMKYLLPIVGHLSENIILKVRKVNEL